MNHFEDIDSYIQCNNCGLSEAQVSIEGNVGEIKRLIIGDKKRQKFSYYGTLIDLDVNYTIKRSR